MDGRSLHWQLTDYDECRVRPEFLIYLSTATHPSLHEILLVWSVFYRYWYRLTPSLKSAIPRVIIVCILIYGPPGVAFQYFTNKSKIGTKYLFEMCKLSFCMLSWQRLQGWEAYLHMGYREPRTWIGQSQIVDRTWWSLRQTIAPVMSLIYTSEILIKSGTFYSWIEISCYCCSRWVYDIL